MLPLALMASVLLHLTLLLAPGWELPPDRIATAAPLAAMLPQPARPPTASRPTTASPAVPKSPPPRKALLADAATVLSEPDSRPPAPPEPASEPASELVEPPPAAAAPTEEGTSVADVSAHWPVSGQLVFELVRGADGFVIGRNEMRWEHDGRNYRLRSETKPTGLVALLRPGGLVLESRGRVDAAGLQPLEFVGERTGKAAEHVIFDPAAGRILLSNGESRPYVAGAQDLLSLPFHLSVLGVSPPRMELPVAVGRRLIAYTVDIREADRLDSPFGQREVRLLVLSGEKREDAMELWVDMATGLPLKIRHYDRKGEVFEMVAIAFETANTTKTDP